MGQGSIPKYLQEHGRFCLWRSETVGGRKTKIPYCSRNPARKARTADPDTFTSYGEALAALESHKGFNGLGIGIFGDLVGIDIDHCIDETGELSELAAAIVVRLDTYAEKSPSGSGLHLYGTAPGYYYDRDQYYIKHGSLEVYAAGMTNRYLTVTGDIVHRAPVRDLTAALPGFLDDYMKRPECEAAAAGPYDNGLTDQEIIERASQAANSERFRRLWSGDWQPDLNEGWAGYPSQSEADQALCNDLAFWCSKDAERIDKLFRQSGLYREKWEREDYRSGTIKKAVAGCKECYKPPDRSTAADDFSDGPPGSFPPLRSAAEIMALDLQPLRVFVGAGSDEPLLVEGTCIISAKPKLGKSWFVLHLCLAVASGSDFLGYKTQQCGALYFDLESDDHIRKKRIAAALQGRPVPEHFYIVGRAGTAGSGLEEQIRYYLDQDPTIGLVVVDVFQRVRTDEKNKETGYQHAYRDIIPINDLAKERHLSIVLVMHDRKTVDQNDPFSNILGSVGLQAAVDQMIVMYKAKPDSPIHISAKGRAIDGQPDLDAILTDGQFLIADEPDTTEKQESRKLRESYMSSPIREAVLAMAETEGPWCGRCGDLLNDLWRMLHIHLEVTPKTLGSFLSRHRLQFEALDDVQISIHRHGTASREYWISKSTIPTIPTDIRENEENG